MDTDTDNKYRAGKIYKITDMAYTECYVGSTIQPLCKRMAWHRRDYKQYKQGKAQFVLSYAVFDKYGIDNCKIELIEDFPCESKEQLNKREGHHIRNENCVNKCIAGRSGQEYRNDTKDRKKEYDMKYRQDNIDKKKCKDKAYYEANKERLKARSKTYYEANKAVQNEKQRQRYHRKAADSQQALS